MALKRLTPRGPAEAALSPPPSPQEMSFFAYLLAAADNPAKHNYKGSTQDFSVRLLQHNGHLPDGANSTVSHRPWILVAVVSGFTTREGAMAFEYAWQFPTQSPLPATITERGLWPYKYYLARAREACRELGTWRNQQPTAYALMIMRCLLALEDNAALSVRYYGARHFAPPVQLPQKLLAELPVDVVFAPLPALSAAVAGRVKRRAEWREKNAARAAARAASAAGAAAAQQGAPARAGDARPPPLSGVKRERDAGAEAIAQQLNARAALFASKTEVWV